MGDTGRRYAVELVKRAYTSELISLVEMFVRWWGTARANCEAYFCGSSAFFCSFFTFFSNPSSRVPSESRAWHWTATT